MGTRQHQRSTHARSIGWNTGLDREIVGGGRTREIEVDRRLDPITRVSPPSRKLTTVGGTPHAVRAKYFASQREISPVQTVMDAENQVRLIALQHLQVVAVPENDLAAVKEAQAFYQRIEHLVNPRRAA